MADSSSVSSARGHRETGVGLTMLRIKDGDIDLSDSGSDPDSLPSLSEGSDSSDDRSWSCDGSESSISSDSFSESSGSSYNSSESSLSDDLSEEGDSGYESEDSSMFGIESGEISQESSSSGEDEPVGGLMLDLHPMVAYPSHAGEYSGALETNHPTYACVGPINGKSPSFSTLEIDLKGSFHRWHLVVSELLIWIRAATIPAVAGEPWNSPPNAQSKRSSFKLGMEKGDGYMLDTAANSWAIILKLTKKVIQFGCSEVTQRTESGGKEVRCQPAMGANGACSARTSSDIVPARTFDEPSSLLVGQPVVFSKQFGAVLRKGAGKESKGSAPNPEDSVGHFYVHQYHRDTSRFGGDRQDGGWGKGRKIRSRDGVEGECSEPPKIQWAISMFATSFGTPAILEEIDDEHGIGRAIDPRTEILSRFHCGLPALLDNESKTATLDHEPPGEFDRDSRCIKHLWVLYTSHILLFPAIRLEIIWGVLPEDGSPYRNMFSDPVSNQFAFQRRTERARGRLEVQAPACKIFATSLAWWKPTILGLQPNYRALEISPPTSRPFLERVPDQQKDDLELQNTTQDIVSTPRSNLLWCSLSMSPKEPALWQACS
ncbi:hypothetical protein DFP72DRAFT_860419 [Ephemerocybe angulata]|uniref:Uncharacterized protein n=1 Tax=Ephemerocybe angulata TaxID=980116 RepID=A0A8H6H8H0_9AGAR|nr:hypothetical protein DFP72DRAFT_860419 [Tulosesus angulatus]